MASTGDLHLREPRRCDLCGKRNDHTETRTVYTGRHAGRSVTASTGGYTVVSKFDSFRKHNYTVCGSCLTRNYILLGLGVTATLFHLIAMLALKNMATPPVEILLLSSFTLVLCWSLFYFFRVTHKLKKKALQERYAEIGRSRRDAFKAFSQGDYEQLSRLGW